MAKNLDEVKHDLEEEIKENFGEYNEKWVQSISVLENNLSDEITTTGIFKTIYRRIKKVNLETKETLKKFYNKIDNLTSDIITEDDKKEIQETLLKIPKIILSAEDDESFVKTIGELEIGKRSKSVELEPTDNGLIVKDTGHTDSILGKQYTLHVDTDKDKIIEIRPIIPIVMNYSIFKTYEVYSERNGVEVLVDKCKVIAESEDKASDYVIFVCKKMERIKKNDMVKTDVFLDGKQIAGFICKI